MEVTEIEEVGTSLAPVERAALALESTKTEQHLRELAVKFIDITEILDPNGYDQAHRAKMELKRARVAVEKAGKEAREDATKFSKAVIVEVARLVGIVEPEEARLQNACSEWEEKQARIKAEAEAKERARVLAITDRIAAIKEYVVLANNCRTSERVAELQVKLAAIALDDSFAEFIDDARFAHSYTTSHLKLVHTNKCEEEAAAAAKKAEQERIKAEHAAEAARLKAEREEFARQQAKAKAEAEAAEAKVRAAAEAMAAERAELERMRAEMEAKKKKKSGPTYTLMPPEPAFEELAKPVDVPPGVTLIKGEVGTVDAGIAVVSSTKTPVASSIVLAVAEFFCVDTKTAARWITERASEIATLKA